MIIEVAETHPPKAGKKLGTVKTAAGESYGIWPDKLSGLRVGSRYEIEFDESEFAGRMYRKITKAQPVGTSVCSTGAEEQFVSSVLIAAITAGKLQLSTESLVAAIKTIRAAWANTFGASNA